LDNVRRKEKMKGFDVSKTSKMDRQPAKTMPQAEGLLSKAMEQMDEELDDVKHMNHLMLQSKVITVRDKQIEENRRLEDEWLEEQKRLDIMMEIERLKGI